MDANIAKMYIDGFTPDAYARTGLDVTRFARGKRKCGGKKAGRKHHRLGMMAGKKAGKRAGVKRLKRHGGAKTRSQDDDIPLAEERRTRVGPHKHGRKSHKNSWNVSGHTRYRRYQG